MSHPYAWHYAKICFDVQIAIKYKISCPRCRCGTTAGARVFECIVVINHGSLSSSSLSRDLLRSIVVYCCTGSIKYVGGHFAQVLNAVFAKAIPVHSGEYICTVLQRCSPSPLTIEEVNRSIENAEVARSSRFLPWDG